jgi:glyoxylase I family protein
MADPVARLDHVGLVVGDLAAEAAWYCDVFGLSRELTARVEALELSIEMLIHPGYGYRVELLHRPGAVPGSKPANPAEAALRHGYGHVAFDVSDLDDAYERAVARGARPVMPPGPSPEAGVRMAFVADPEDNLVELLQRPPRAGEAGLSARPTLVRDGRRYRTDPRRPGLGARTSRSGSSLLAAVSPRR